MPNVAAIHIYPVKGCGGLSCLKADVTRTGFQYDRQWMFVDESGMFVAQRDSRSLGVAISTTCLIRTLIVDNMLTLRAPSMPELGLPVRGIDGAEVPVRIWDDAVTAIDQGEPAADWATAYLSRERPGRYRLVRMSEDVRRSSRIGGGEVAFGDAYPFLVISEASLDDLNSRMREPLPMNRFRPNIVIAGARAYQEDEMDRFRIGAVEFAGATLCVRCPTTVTNQDTAVRGKEPLRTLARYRKQPDGVVFGRNFNHTGHGFISVGDEISC